MLEFSPSFLSSHVCRGLTIWPAPTTPSLFTSAAPLNEVALKHLNCVGIRTALCLDSVQIILQSIRNQLRLHLRQKE